MLQKHSNRGFIYIIFALLCFDLLSLDTFFYPTIFHLLFLLIVVGFCILALWRFEWAFLLVVAELFVGANGRLFSFPIGGVSFSLRMAFFSILVLIWFFHRFRKAKAFSFRGSTFFSWLAALAFIVIVGTILGFLRHHTTQFIFFDVNGFFYAALALPAFDLLRERHMREKLLLVLGASIVYLGVKTLLLLGLFSHGLDVLTPFYRWLRNTRMFEITAFTQSYYRIFSQAQMFSLLGFCIFFGKVFVQPDQWKKRPRDLIILLFASVTLIVSLSRSFWLGFAVALVGMSLFALHRYGWPWKRVGILWASMLVVIAGELLLISFVANFPYLYGKGAVPFRALEERTTTIDEPAIGHRSALILPLLRASLEHPLLGSGFGRTLTFRTIDPRIVAETGGERTTFAFEWGFLDLLLKSGLLGVIVILGLGWSLVGESRFLLGSKRLNDEDRGLVVGLLAGLVALYVTHVVSPYLNHPIGIGYLLLMGAFLYGIRRETLHTSST